MIKKQPAKDRSSCSSSCDCSARKGHECCCDVSDNSLETDDLAHTITNSPSEEQLLQRVLKITERFLAVRPRSKGEMISYFRYRRKMDPDVIPELVGIMEKYGLINDESFTRWYAQARLQSGWGRHRIIQDLRMKGIEKEMIEEAFKDVYPEDEEQLGLKVCQALIRRYKAKDKLRERVLMGMTRKGFNYQESLKYWQKCQELNNE